MNNSEIGIVSSMNWGNGLSVLLLTNGVTVRTTKQEGYELRELFLVDEVSGQKIYTSVSDIRVSRQTLRDGSWKVETSGSSWSADSEEDEAIMDALLASARWMAAELRIIA